MLNKNLPHGCTSFKLRQLSRRVSQRYDAEMAAIGLKTTQYSLLTALVALGPIQPRELAREMAMEPSTLTRNLKPLITAGWATMAPGDDGRSRRVEATADGRHKRREAQRRWKIAQTNLNNTLGTDRVVALHGLLDESLSLLQVQPEADDD